ncbi:hypothetical protein RRG08_026943 [Elysia crispata]|uniref:Morc S5 domain-containing protein n=1 Tax=Elysia crispata TaxID=231223 RepID=A0AAE0YS62_9GAST|nr:hypothetical protein RRG08_026943 [Elysia crispata]
MIIHIRGKKVRSKLVSTCLNSPEYLNYHPRNEKKSIRVTFGFTWEHDTSEDYGMMLYHRNRLIKAFERVGYQKQSNNAYGIGVVGVAEVDFLEPIHTKQDFIRNTIFNNAIKWFGDKLNDYWNDKKTSRTPSNTRSQRGGRTESRDPATNLTPPEREINLGILDNAQYPVNQNQTQQSDVSPISIKPNKPKEGWFWRSLYEKHTTSTCTSILHVHIWRWEFGFEYREGWFWTTLYEKHTTSTCTITPILHVRKTLFSYTHSRGNFACTHLALGIRFRVYRGGVLDHLVRKTYHIYMHSDPNSACTQNTFFVHAAILHVHAWPTYVDYKSATTN